MKVGTSTLYEAVHIRGNLCGRRVEAAFLGAKRRSYLALPCGNFFVFALGR
jgi:hypothetical protein